ncbi:MAG TPA: DUF2065 domain-containing protein [Steroidobacteraceae bacterium]
MQLHWSDLLAAFALYLVLEGMMPFLNPQLMKRVMLSLAESPDRQLRLTGFGSMLAGLVLLYLARA